MESRVEIFRQILRFSSDHHVRLSRFWTGFIETARFKLGESIKDIKVPFSLDSESTEAIQAALDSLFELARRRYEVQFKAPTDRSIEDFSGIARLGPRHYSLRNFRKDSLEGVLLGRILASDPIFDAGILDPWLNPKGAGARLIATIQGILHKALVDEVKADHLEKSAYMVFLGLSRHLAQAKAVIKNKSIKGIAYEQLDIAFANLIYLVMSSVMEAILEGLRSRRVSMQLEQTFLLLQSSCHPLTYAGIKSSILKFRFNPYGLAQETVDLLDPIYRKISQKDTDLQFVHRGMHDEILASGKHKSAVLGEAVLHHFRQRTLEFLAEYDQSGSAVIARLRELIQDHTALFNCLCDPRSVAQLADQFKTMLRQEPKPEERAERLAELEAILRYVHKGSLFKKPPLPPDLIERILDRYLSYKIDLYVDQYTSEALNLLDNRQSRLAVGQLKQDFEAGRLYRISSDNHPLLREFVETLEGQLFIDLKDFTKRTHFSKEVAMAEFLGNEFYKPILDASRKYHPEITNAGKPIELINLLGDAVIFSGNIESLVFLAQDIQNIFKDYRQKLKAQTPSNLESELSERLETRFKRGTEQLQNASQKARARYQSVLDEIRERIQSNFKKYSGELPELLAQEVMRLETEFLALDGRISAEADPQKRFEVASERNLLTQKLTSLRGLQKQYIAQFRTMSGDQQIELLARYFCRDLYTEKSVLEESLETLQKREQTLRYEFERDIKKIEGFGMDAGLFISYGSAAEHVKIQDEIWGEQEVAIAETINESARGTARNPMIKKMLEARLAEQLRLRGKADLAYPYHVFVEKTYSFQLSPRKNAEFHSALKNSNLPQAEQILQQLLYESVKETRDHIQSPSSGSDEQRTLVVARDIYNEGEAVSEEALNAFLRETTASRYNFKKALSIRKFHQQILEQFLFLTDQIQLVMSCNHQNPKQDPLIFRYAGELTFRGFENRGDTGVFELLKFDSPFYQLLLRYHFDDWLKEFDSGLGAPESS